MSATLEIAHNGNKRWCDEYGRFHRETGPAIEYTSGLQVWYTHGKWQKDVNFKDGQINDPSEDFPAYRDCHGVQRWYDRGRLYKAEWYTDDEGLKRTELYDANGDLHSEESPAVSDSNGSKIWYKHGKMHCEQGPAFIGSDGTQEWRINGQLHRKDGPARTLPNGTREYWLNGEWLLTAIHKNDELHCINGPAYFTRGGYRSWFFEGLRHREDGPALIRDSGTRMWYRFNKLHREDGPAVEHANGFRGWYLNGVRVKKEDVLGAPSPEHPAKVVEAKDNDKNETFFDFSLIAVLTILGISSAVKHKGKNQVEKSHTEVKSLVQEKEWKS